MRMRRLPWLLCLGLALGCSDDASDGSTSGGSTDNGNDPYADALERRDAKRPGRALGERVQIGLGGAHRRNGPRSVSEQSLARLGRGHRAPSTGAFE